MIEYSFKFFFFSFFVNHLEDNLLLKIDIRVLKNVNETVADHFLLNL